MITMNRVRRIVEYYHALGDVVLEDFPPQQPGSPLGRFGGARRKTLALPLARCRIAPLPLVWRVLSFLICLVNNSMPRFALSESARRLPLGKTAGRGITRRA